MLHLLHPCLFKKENSNNGEIQVLALNEALLHIGEQQSSLGFMLNVYLNILNVSLMEMLIGISHGI